MTEKTINNLNTKIFLIIEKELKRLFPGDILDTGTLTAILTDVLTDEVVDFLSDII